MSMQAINFALTLPVDEPGPRLTLICIAFHVGYRSGDMFVGQEELAREVRVSSRAIRNYLITLEDAGLITREERRVEGKRTSDRIALVGYLEWQHVLEHGGTISNPATRGKTVKKLPEKSSGDEVSTGTTASFLPEQNVVSTGTCVPVHIDSNLSNHKINLNAQAGACEANASPACAEDGEKSGAVIVLRGAVSWPHWLDHLRQAGHRGLAEAIEAAGGLKAASKWWSPSGPLPAPYNRSAQLTDASRRMSGDAP